MSAPLDVAIPVVHLLRTTRRRLIARDGLVATATALAAATLIRLAVTLWVGSSLQLDLATLGAGVLVFLVLFHRRAVERTPAAAARTVEAVHPAFRNLLITAEELERYPDRADASIRDHIVGRAAREAAHVHRNAVISTRQIAGPAAVIALIGAFNLLLSERQATRDALGRVAAAISPFDRPARAVQFTVTVTPPAYVGAGPQRLDNPERIEALTGSRLVFALDAGTPARIRFGDTDLTGTRLEHVVGSSGYFVIDAEGSAERRFLPLTAAPDSPPNVRISAPGKDLLIAAGDRTIQIDVTASDDLALRSLEVRFTKVSGSGEQFEFAEGSLPVAIERTSAREWRGRTTLSLPRMKLAPGDSLVYRAVSRDSRPDDAGLAMSDTYFVEILGPGQEALEGVEMPPELERYGLSQQMIVLKLERLRADEGRLARAPLIEQLASIAAEQRTVRANFIFLLGGHVEDEFEEAEQSHEIQEGRLENTARRDINTAIAHMTRAEQGMTAVNTTMALSSAREAVNALQRAFGRNRYLLRSLAVRSRLDPARRLTGDARDAADWRRLLAAAPAREGDHARVLLDAVLSAGQRWTPASPAPPREVEELAEALLAVDPSSATWQQAAQRLLDVRQGTASRGEIAKVIEDVAGLLRSEAARGVLRQMSALAPASPLRRAYEAEARR